MKLLRDLEPYDDDGRLLVVVETPSGSPVKLKYSAAFNAFTWSRALPTGLNFPGDYGFVPSTLAGDGEELDALIVGTSAGVPGVVVPSRIIGALELYQQRAPAPERDNHRLLVVPCNEHRLGHITEAAALGQRRLDELENFFRAYLALTDKTIRTAGWLDAAGATSLVSSMLST
jgi:inorganic pyrophosphatase